MNLDWWTKRWDVRREQQPVPAREVYREPSPSTKWLVRSIVLVSAAALVYQGRDRPAALILLGVTLVLVWALSLWLTRTLLRRDQDG